MSLYVEKQGARRAIDKIIETLPEGNTIALVNLEMDITREYAIPDKIVRDRVNQWLQKDKQLLFHKDTEVIERVAGL